MSRGSIILIANRLHDWRQPLVWGLGIYLFFLDWVYTVRPFSAIIVVVGENLSESYFNVSTVRLLAWTYTSIHVLENLRCPFQIIL